MRVRECVGLATPGVQLDSLPIIPPCPLLAGSVNVSAAFVVAKGFAEDSTCPVECSIYWWQLPKHRPLDRAVGTSPQQHHAVLCIQSLLRGRQAKMQLLELVFVRRRENRLEGAILIQALARGMLARNRVAHRKTDIIQQQLIAHQQQLEELKEFAKPRSILATKMPTWPWSGPGAKPSNASCRNLWRMSSTWHPCGSLRSSAP